MAEKLVPNLRFAGFNDEWASQKFKDNLDIKSGKGFKASEYSKIGIPLLKIDNVSYGKVSWETKDYLPREYLDKYPDLVLKADDIVLALNRPITNNKLKIAKLTKEDEISILYQRVGKIFVNEDSINKEFIFQLLNKEIFRFVLKNSVGSDQPFISTNQLKELEFNVPQFEEQEKIGKFLFFINTKIELLEKKYLGYQDFKKYLMQQIFTQKLRFDFSDDWKQYKIKELLSVKSSNISINQLEDNTGEYPLYGASGFLKNIDFCEMGTDYISIVKDGSGVGNLSYHEGNSSIVNTSQYLLPKKNFNIHFLYYYLQTLNLKKYINGSSIPHIYFKDYCIEKVKVPSLSEQNRIGRLFLDIDKTLENLNKNIELSNEFKKGLLQQMFI